ncbi:MAG: Nif3-like dinuclear metal center hexameric protein [Oscillospiraceae bacterium]
MVTVSDVLKKLCELAPIERKMDFDNVGLLVGSGRQEVSKIITALDITDEVINEAVSCGAELIVSHHPLFFELKKITDDDLAGRKVLKLAENKLSAICMHTNLDVSAGGVNDALAESIGLENFEPMLVDGTDENGDKYGLGRFGSVRSQSFLSFLGHVKSALGASGLRYFDAGLMVRKVAVCGGSGGSELYRAFELGCDTYVTADIKYNVFLDAAELPINLIDAGHYPTENVVVEYLKSYLKSSFPELEILVSKKHSQPEKFF